MTRAEFPNPNRLVDLKDYLRGESFPPCDDVIQRAVKVRAEAIERAITSWAEQAGVDVEEWARSWGYTVETRWEEFTVTFVVKPMFGYPGQEVVMPPAREAGEKR